MLFLIIIMLMNLHLKICLNKFFLYRIKFEMYNLLEFIFFKFFEFFF